jgi:arylsulfatase A-like enzyme
MWVQREQKDVEGFTTELFGEQAREFIKRSREHKFFLQLAFNAVHNFAHQLPPEYLKAKGLKGFEDQKEGEEYWAWRRKIGYPVHPEGRDYYLGQLYFLDREIGLLMRHLKELGLEENTAVVFVSDNGGSLVTYANNGDFKGGKYTLFEGGTRVQMMVSYPAQLKSGIVNDSVVSAMDLFPTICSLTGAPTPNNLDGVDITPLLKGEKESLYRAPLFWDTKAERAMRKGKWKLLITTKTPNPQLQIAPTPKGTFLFNIEEDPGETKNLASKYPEVVRELTQELKNWQQGI